MKTVRIGMIDSGKGGLTVANALCSYPGYEIYYYADTANLPYGNKTYDQLRIILLQTLQIVSQYNVDCIILACHTLSTINTFPEYKNIPIITMLETVTPYAHRATKSNTIGILATAASIKTHAHKQALLNYNPELNIIEQACPELASALELLPPDHPDVIKLLQSYLQSMHNPQLDTLILGCTHYAFAHKEITALVPNAVRLISSEMYITDTMKAAGMIPEDLAEPSTIIQIDL